MSCLLLVGSGAPVLAQQSFQYVYDPAGQLQRVLDSSGTQIEYVYDAVGNIIAIERTTVGMGLRVLGFAPQSGPVGAVVTVQGRGFATEPAGNFVSIGGVTATVTTVNDGGTSLGMQVPLDAVTGPIVVTVAGEQSASEESFVVLAVPAIDSLSPRYVLQGRTQDVVISGSGLGDATLSVLPLTTPPMLIGSVLAQADTMLTWQVTAAADASGGSFVVIATNVGGSSDGFSHEGNALHVLTLAGDEDFDRLSNAEEDALGTDPMDPDSDRDGMADGDEVEGGSDPLDPESRPFDPDAPGAFEAIAGTVSVLDTAQPLGPATLEAVALTAAVLNDAVPPSPASLEAVALTVAVLNEAEPLPPVGSEAAALTVSVWNVASGP